MDDPFAKLNLPSPPPRPPRPSLPPVEVEPESEPPYPALSEPPAAVAVPETPLPLPPSLTEQQMVQLRQAFEAVLIRTASSPPGAPEGPPSIAAKVARKTMTATRIGMLVLGAASVAAEFIAARYPHVVGPLGSLLKIGLRLLGEAPTP
jgi:hypothetical protein